MRNEGRFRVVEKADPRRFQRLLKSAEKLTRQRYAVYQQLAGITVPLFETAEAKDEKAAAPLAEPR
jgi:hypothetical protein